MNKRIAAGLGKPRTPEVHFLHVPGSAQALATEFVGCLLDGTHAE